MNKLMDILIGTSAALIVIGAFFKLQHYPYGNQMIWIGFISQMILTNLEIARLKKIIRNQEEKIK